MNKDISFIDFTNMSDEEKYKLLNSKDYEIERLNNIINEFEKWAEDYRFANIFKDKLQELKKGSDK